MAMSAESWGGPCESGIGEEDMLTLVLPYVQTVKECFAWGAPENTGPMESNLEWLSADVMKSGGWSHRRSSLDGPPYLTMQTNPNQLGSDRFELDRPEEFLCDPDLSFLWNDGSSLTLVMLLVK